MKVKCVGASFFNRKKDGKPLMALHCMYPMNVSADGTRKGYETKVFFVSLENSEFIFGCIADQLELDNFVDYELDLSFNMNGFIDSVSVIQ